MSKIVGIDLGTTFSVIAILNDVGKPEVLANYETNQKVTASAIYIDPDNKKVQVGEKALNYLKTDPDKVITAIKQKMSDEVVYSLSKGDWIDKNTSDKDEDEYSPAQLSSFILSKLKEFNPETKDVIITVPAMFGEAGRLATQDAAKIAGINVIQLINEPTAAILHYASLPDIKVIGNIMVFDLGGGTFDISIAKVTKNGAIEMLNSVGDQHLGGHNFDESIIEDIADKYFVSKKKKLTNQDKKRLFPIAEKIKKTLSFKEETNEMIDIGDGVFEYSLTRNTFYELIDFYITKIKMLTETSLDGAVPRLSKSDINQILLVGGSSRMPFVNDLIKNSIGKAPTKGVDVDEAVASGAAIFAGLNSDKSDLTSGQIKTLKNDEIEDVSNSYLGTPMLATDKERDQQRIVNDILIKRNTKLPISVTRDYYTVGENQTIVNCIITQSEGEFSDLEFVNEIANKELKLPPDRPEGQQIDVTFTLDKSGKLRAEFLDVASGEKTEIDVRPESSLRPEDSKLDFSID